MTIKRHLLSVILVTLGQAFFYPSYGQQTKLKVHVDERMELLTTVQYLSDYFLLASANSPYKKDIDAYFAKIKNHPVIELNKIIQNNGFNADTPPWYLYHFSFPDLKSRAPFTQEEKALYEYDSYGDTLELFKTLLEDFYQKSGFNRFYKDHIPFYDSITAPIRSIMNQQDYIALLEKHYGKTFDGYELVLTPLLHDGGYNMTVNTDEGTQIISIIGPRSYDKETSRFDAENILQNYVLHEFSHAFCNPIIEKNYLLLAQDSCLIKPILKEQNEQGYGGDWQICLFEHLVRANEVVLNKLILGQESANKVYNKYYKDRKWIYLDGLVPIIEKVYLSDRETYRTQDDLAPKIIEYFNEQKEKNCH